MSWNLQNAGAHWVNQEVVEHGLENRRNRDYILAFNRKMIEVFSHAQQAQQRVSEFKYITGE